MREFVTIIDVPTPQVAINAIIVEYSEDLQKEFGVNAALHRPDSYDQGSHSTPSFSSNLGAAASNTDLGFSGAGLKKILNDIGGIFSSGTNTIIGRLPDDFYATIHLLETQDKAKVMAQPSIVTLNGNKASISVDETQYFKLTTGNPLGTDYSIQFKPITFGIKLDITPWISQGGQITAEIAPEVSNSDGANSDGYPNVSLRTLSTTVRLNDGETITLGGLIKNTESESHNKIPLLGDIPLLGALFRTNTKSIQKTNLIVYVTPHIIKKEAHLDLDSALQNMDINSADFLERKAREIFHKNGPQSHHPASPSDSTHTDPGKAVETPKDPVSSKGPAVEQPEYPIDKNGPAFAPSSDAMLKRYAAPKDTLRPQSPATLKNAPAQPGGQTKQPKSLNDTNEIAH